MGYRQDRKKVRAMRRPRHAVVLAPLVRDLAPRESGDAIPFYRDTIAPTESAAQYAARVTRGEQ